MHAFEDLVGRLVQRDGYWVRHSVKVDLAKEEKVALGQPSLPRPELDLVAYRPSDNVLALIECKSFLDSNGVNIKAFEGTDPEKARRYRLFTDEQFRAVVTRKLLVRLVEEGAVPEDANVRFWLVAGKVMAQSAEPLRRLFGERAGWELFDRDWIRGRLLAIRDDLYEDDVVVMAMKLSH